jgi:cell division septation protein DedD
VPEFNFLKRNRTASLSRNKDTDENLRIPPQTESVSEALHPDEGRPSIVSLERGGTAEFAPAAVQSTSDTEESSFPSSIDTYTHSRSDDNSLVLSIESATSSDSGRKKVKKIFSQRFVATIILICAFITVFWQLRIFSRMNDLYIKLERGTSVATTALSRTHESGTKAILPMVQRYTDSLRDWNFYLQLSSWKKLKDAERVAQDYRDRGITIKVQCIYLQVKRATVYRVRCGPFPTRNATNTFKTSNTAILPSDAFVDSIRAEQDPAGVRSVETLTLPTSGFGIPISSFDQSLSAKKRALELAEQYAVPVFINVQQIHMTSWYRVFIGPFQSRNDAQRQAKFLTTFLKNEMREIDLNREK